MLPSLIKRYLVVGEATSDKPNRRLLKALTYRICGSAATTLIAWLMTGHVSVSLVLGSADMVVKGLMYLLHERIWDCIALGLRPALKIPTPPMAHRDDGRSVVSCVSLWHHTSL